MKISILIPSLVLAAAGSFNAVAWAGAVRDHQEFEATLHAPWRGASRPGSRAAVRSAPAAADARTFTLSFDYPGLAQPTDAAWRLELLAPNGRLVREWQGRVALDGQPHDVAVHWSGSAAGRPLAAGIYRVRLHAQLGDSAEPVDQDWQIAVGRLPAPALPAFAPLPTAHPNPTAAPAPGALPYTVYYGNLHSQTKHSDGGGALAACHGAQDPQSGAAGPDTAFAYARAHGLDLLMASEHNHMFDGSDATNADADPAAARALYQSGLRLAREANAAHPEFLALYGMEWGVIGNGGHLNIFNSDALLGWERNGKGELLADTETARSDYAALYTLMRQQGWVGQFNHPAQDGQFVVGGKALAYTADGDAAMALCEVMNTSAFSNNENEGETRRSNFEGACNKLLEAGYHVAFSSDQDNHCANWGASYGNRTAVLVPNGVPLTRESFIEALRARRVFATMDKNSQLVLSANGHLMGERFDNRGPLALNVQWSGDPARHVATVAIMEGVPGRNGEVSQLSDAAQAAVVPAPGPHFYYAKVTQDDGRVLWSAPLWVTQAAD